MVTKAIARSKIKTDKVGAHVLAQLLRCDFLPEVRQPDEASRLRRQLSGRRASLVGQRTQLRNRIQSVMAMRLIVPSATLFGKDGRTWLNRLTEKHIDAEGLAMIVSPDYARTCWIRRITVTSRWLRPPAHTVIS